MHEFSNLEAQFEKNLVRIPIFFPDMKLGMALDFFEQNSLIRLCLMFGDLGLAYEVFDEMFVRDLGSN